MTTDNTTNADQRATVMECANAILATSIGQLNRPLGAKITLEKSAFASRMQQIVDQHNHKIDLTNGDPDADGEPYPHLTLHRIALAFAKGEIAELEDEMSLFFPDISITESVVQDLLGADYDPWPSLDLAELRFLLGDRAGRKGCLRELTWCVYTDREPGLIVKLIASEHREWLQAGEEKKRKRLAKALAEVAKLSGEVA